MKKLILITFFIFSRLVLAESVDEKSLLLHEEFSKTQPNRYTKYTLENNDIKILIFKINYQEPPLNPFHFKVYFQCKSDNSYKILKRAFQNSAEEALSYCSHEPFHIGTVEGKGSKEYLILPMRRDNNHICPTKPNSIELYPIEEMKEKCTKL